MLKRFLSTKPTAEFKLKRFWKNVSFEKRNDGFAVLLDSKELKTPAGSPVRIPLEKKILAEYTAAEWNGQLSVLKAHSLPITSVVMRSLDSLQEQEERHKVIESLLKYVHTDSICYQQDYPSSFVELQEKYWKPIIEWIEEEYGLEIKTTTGILRVSQPEKVIQTFREIVQKYDNFKLAAFEKAVLRTKSFMIGLALIERAISVEFATAAARVEVQQQINKWGEVQDNHDLDREEMKVQLGASVIAVIDGSELGIADLMNMSLITLNITKGKFIVESRRFSSLEASQITKMSENILVVGRCRPFSEKESKAGHSNITEIDIKSGSIKLTNPKNLSESKQFSFDAMFDANSTQMEVYKATSEKIVEASLQGYNGTIFCYGQTGTGKTYSMQGIPSEPDLRGIIPTCFHHIFDHISSTNHKKYLVRVSFLEIYNESIRDLLIKPKNNPKGGLELKENPESGIYVKNLSVVVVKSVAELERLMQTGNNNRSVGETLMNASSSRSHSIFTITIESSEVGDDGQEKFVSGKLNLVDLAGSERQSKTGTSGDRLKEATRINLSLSALGNCISALVDGKSSHIPYRDSKLTRMLQDSLGGNSKTVMIATLSPASFNYEETMSTLRYANRAKSIKNKPVINEDPKDAMLREYQNEIMRLRMELEARKNGGSKAINKKSSVFKDKVKNGDQLSQSTTEGYYDPLSCLDPDTIAKLQAEVEIEKKALLASKDMVVEEKLKIAAELEKRAADLQAAKTAREELANQLHAMEAKLLVGGVHIEDKINQQEKELQHKEAQVQEEEKKKQILERKLESKQEAQMQLEENFSSLQEEVDSKTKNLKRMFAKVQQAKNDVSDLLEEFRAEKEDILDTIRDLSKDYALKLAIIENFIPPQQLAVLKKRLVYDEEFDDWRLAPFSSLKIERLKRPMSANPSQRPLCNYAKKAILSGNADPRYRPDNILNIQLKLPERTTLGDFVCETRNSPAISTLGSNSSLSSQKRPQTRSRTNLLGILPIKFAVYSNLFAQMNEEPIKFIFKPTKRILKNFFEPLRKKVSKTVKADQDEISKRYHLIDINFKETKRKLKIEFEPILKRMKPKSWSDELFAPLNLMSEVDNEEELYVVEPESPELDRYIDNFSCLPSREDSFCELIMDQTAERISNSVKPWLPQHELEILSDPVLDYGSTVETNLINSIPSKEIVLIDSDEENAPLEPQNQAHDDPVIAYLDQRLFDSHHSIGDDLATQLFGAEDRISEYQVDNNPLTYGPSTIIIEDSSDIDPIANDGADKTDSSDLETPPTNLNNPLLEQLRNQFKPKERVGKKNAKKAGAPAAGSSNNRSAGKPFKRRFNRGGWKRKK